MIKQLSAVGALLCFSVGPTFAEVANDDDTLALAAVIDNTTFARDKIEIGNRLSYWAPVFETLLQIMPDGSIAPNLATEWSWNDDGTVLNLKLREGVSFTDGTPFDAEAVKANIEALRNGAGQNVWMVKSVADYEIVSPTEINIIVPDTDPALVRNLTLVAGAMASPASLGTEGGAAVPVGTGPYIYNTDETVQGRQYVYTRNGDYWNAEAFEFDQITITPIRDVNARSNAIKSGQIDIALINSKTAADAEASGFQVMTNAVDWTGIFLADREGKLNPALADVRVRQAINHAFDDASILKFIELGYGTLSDQIFPATSPAYLAELDDFYPYDPEKAKALMAEAGYSELELTMPAGNFFAPYNPVIEQQLKDIGITINWVKEGPDTFIGSLISGKYGAFQMRLGNQSTWGDMLKTATQSGAWNVQHPEDPDMAALLDAVKATSGDAQVEAFQAVNRYMVENAWFAPWYRLDAITMVSNDITAQDIPGNVVTFPRFYGKAE